MYSRASVRLVLPSTAGRQSEGLKRTLARISRVLLLYCCVADGETFGSQQQTVLYVVLLMERPSGVSNKQCDSMERIVA